MRNLKVNAFPYLVSPRVLSSSSLPLPRNFVGMVLLLVSATTAMSQEVDLVSGADLFSPPSVVRASGTGVPVDELLSITKDALPETASVFDARSDASLPAAAPIGGPTDVPTPELISTPAVQGIAPNPSSTVSQDGWNSTECYQNAVSLWGQVDSGPVPQFATSMPQSYGVETFAPAAIPSGSYGCGSSSWSRFDVLLWNIDGYATPALITRAPGGVVQNGAGALGGDGTQVLYGNQELGDDLRLGGRMQLGHWFGPSRRVGIQTDFFGLGGDSQSAVFTGDGTNIYARPFFNTNPAVDAQDAQVFAMPGLADGSVRFNTSSEVWSAGPSFRFNVCCSGGCDPCNPCGTRSRRVDFLLGYRFLRLEESLAARETLRPTGGTFVDGTTYDLHDRIRTRNDFHGVEIGINRLTQRGPWLWDLSAICALGEVERVVDLNGSTRVLVPGVSDDTFPGAFYVGPGDIGRFRDNDFAAIPQVRANLSYCLGCNWRLSVGYNFMYLSSAFRPGQFLNTTFDGARLGQQVAVDSVRQPTFRRDDLFLHGANVGMTYNF